MRRLVTWEDVEELTGVVHREREDQPIWFSSSERGLGCGRGGVAIAQGEVGEAGEQMCFDESVRREAGWRHHARSVSEDCQRRGIKVLMIGSIASLGRNYVITLEGINSQSGETVAHQQTEAEGKEQVLKALGKAASQLREKLGESLSSIKKFDAPIEQATTSSLEALKAFSQGNEQRLVGNQEEAIPFYKRAIELDPNFALAYARLAVTYNNSFQTELAAQYSQKAYDLRDRVSERERFYISEKQLRHWRSRRSHQCTESLGAELSKRLHPSQQSGGELRSDRPLRRSSQRNPGSSSPQSEQYDLIGKSGGRIHEAEPL